MLKSLSKSINSAAASVSKEVDHLSRDVNHAFDSSKSSLLLDNFKNGNIIQLISRRSGHSLQAVQAANGGIVVDGRGPEGVAQEIWFSHFTVTNEGKNIIRLCSGQHNFLAIVNGSTCIMPCPNPGVTPPETRFRLAQTGQFVTLESLRESGRHVGILQDGQLKPAVATGKEMDAHFGVKLVMEVQAPPPPPAPIVVPARPGTVTVVTTTTTTTKKK